MKYSVLIHWSLGDFNGIFRKARFGLISEIGGWDTSWEIALRWLPLHLIFDKWTLVQVMAWSGTKPLSEPKLTCGVTKPQWSNLFLLVQIRPDTVVHAWKGDWKAEMAAITAQKFRALLSTPWYLDLISYGADWHNYYMVEPLAFNGKYKFIAIFSDFRFGQILLSMLGRGLT